MLRSLNTLMNFTVYARDEAASTLDDVCIDNASWNIRYLVLNCGNWLTGRAVVLATHQIANLDADAQRLTFDLNKADIEASPELKAVTALSRGFEERLYKHYGWSPYWSESAEPDLNTLSELLSYEVVHNDQTLGWVKDVIYDDQSWKATSLIFDTGKTLREKIIEVKLDRITDVDHENKRFTTTMTRDEAENCEPFNLMALIQSQS